MAGEIVNSVEMLRRLVAFDTTSRNSNLALIEYVQRLSQGARHRVQAGAERGRHQGQSVRHRRSQREGRRRAERPYRRRAGRRPAVGHRSVDAHAQGRQVLWPRHLRHEGVLRHRAQPCCPRSRSAKLKRPIHFALSYDEEIGCIGAHALAARMASEVPRPRAIIIGEPTMMTVVHAHKGAQIYVTKFTGFEAHSSMTHLGVSAIHFAGEFIHYLNTGAGRARRQGAQEQRVHAGRRDLQCRHHHRRHGGQHPGPRVRRPVGLSRAAEPSRSRRWASAPWNGWRRICCPR